MNPPEGAAHIQFSKELENYGFREFLETTLQLTMEYSKNSQSKNCAIGRIYVEHLQETEARLNGTHEDHLQKVKAQFKQEIFELKSLNPDLYQKTKIRYLYVAEQTLLYQEFANQKYAPSAKYFHLKQPDGQFTPNRWMHALLLSEPTFDKKRFESQKKQLLEEHTDIALIKAFLTKTPSKDPFTRFASRAIIHLKKTKYRLEWKEGALTDSLLSDANLSSKEKELELTRSFTAYLISLTKLCSTKMSKKTPKKNLSDLLSSTEPDTEKIVSMEQTVYHLTNLKKLSSPSQNISENTSSPKESQLKFFSKVKKCQKLLSDFLVLLKSTVQKDLPQAMNGLQISSSSDEAMEIDFVNTTQMYITSFERTKRIFDAIVTHTSLP